MDVLLWLFRLMGKILRLLGRGLWWLVRLPFGHTHRRKGGTHGSSRWATRWEQWKGRAIRGEGIILGRGAFRRLLRFSTDGMVHYYAKPGVDDLTQADYITSQYPYGYRAERFRTFFYNVCSADDGRRWSTDWIVDDPQVFLARPRR